MQRLLLISAASYNMKGLEKNWFWEFLWLSKIDLDTSVESLMERWFIWNPVINYNIIIQIPIVIYKK